MPIEGTPLQMTNQAGIGTNHWRIREPVAQADDDLSACNFKTDTGVRYIRVTPGLTNINDSPYATPDNTADGPGWNILVADMDTILADQPAKRIIRAGTLTFNCVLVGSTADTATQYGVQIRLFKRLAAGTYSFLTSAETVGKSMLITAQDVDVPVVLGTDVLFDLGESLHVEVWVKGKGFAIVGQTVRFKVGANIVGQQDTTMAHSLEGLRYRYERAQAGTVTPGPGSKVFGPSGVILRRSGLITPGPGTRLTKVNLFRTGTVTPTGALLKLSSKFFLGSSTPVGTLLKRPTKLPTGTITPGPGLLVRKPILLRGGTITPTGALTKFISVFKTGLITPAGVLRKTIQFGTPFSGLIAPVGALLKQPGKLLTGLITPTGTVQALLRKNFLGSITPTGQLRKGLFKALAGTITPVGTIRKSVVKFFSGFLGPGEGGAPPPPIVKKVLLGIFDD